MGHRTQAGAPLPGVPDRHPAVGSPLRRLDPRTRLLAVCAFAAVVIVLEQPAALGAALALALLLILVARQPLRRILRPLAAMDGLMLIMLLTLPFTTPGTPLLQLGTEGAWGTASVEGLWLAVDIALTANAILLMLLALLGDLDPVHLGHALHRLHLPMALVQLLQFTLRYINLIHDEFSRLRVAMRARGFVAGTNRHSIRSLGYALGTLLVRSLDRSERVLCAMQCRGFTGHFPVVESLRFGSTDALVATLGVLVFSGLLWLEWHLG
ncbi:cobalt ECF transporter T component CbiQ [Rhabdochromatium marinum]|uniref:cobalt ECF transporter T component CbiQ n=1 Tax=Rhabdochromatium marinum TaxID=48729 RepID=UPI0019061700|nr:cobalt ECF transporter T component CbiQ [Rhabdochromatium marinum]MBK1649887.1 cobalt ECF transporter T component CbiQ [Rhabdochromatium marinum]